MGTITLIPAYGRDYRSKKALLADLNAGKDFTIADMSSRWDGSYVNLPQLIEANLLTLYVRYGQLRKVAAVNIKGGKAC